MSDVKEFGSITVNLNKAKDGDADGLRELWNRYHRKLIYAARRKLGDIPKRVVDEEDVAIMAFHSFSEAVGGNRFPQLNDRDDLWQVLFLLVSRQAAHTKRDATRQKRGGGRVRGESGVRRKSDYASSDGFDQFEGPQELGEVATQMAELVESLTHDFKDPVLGELAALKLQGFTEDEIARKQKCSVSTVRRRLSAIRGMWSDMA